MDVSVSAQMHKYAYPKAVFCELTAANMQNVLQVTEAKWYIPWYQLWQRQISDALLFVTRMSVGPNYVHN